MFAGAALSMVAVGLLGVAVIGSQQAQVAELPRLPAVVASTPFPADSPSEAMATPAFAASMSTGMPVWPALLLAEEGTLRFATSELRPVSWEPARPQH